MGPKEAHNPGVDDPPTSRNKGKESSLASRIASSASGLAKDMVGNSSANEFAASLSSASGIHGKGANGSSSSSHSTWIQDLPSRTSDKSTRGLSGHIRDDLGENLKGPGYPVIAPGIEDNSSALPPLESLNPASSSNSVWASQFWHATDYHSSGDVMDDLSQVAEADGADVRMLLSDPTLSFEVGLGGAVAEDNTEQTASELFGDNFSVEEQALAQKIKSTLPSPARHGAVSPDNPLNLRPDFSHLAATKPQLHDDIADLASRIATHSDMDMLSSSWSQQQRILTEWEDVLTSYTDDVWGEFLPAVKAARKELQEVKAGTGSIGNKSVARLKMILGHVVQDSTSTASHQAGTQAQNHNMTQQHKEPAFAQGTTSRLSEKPTMVGTGVNAIRYPLAVQQPQQRVNYMQQKQASPADQLLDRSNQAEQPVFHCPWISCHERFYHDIELRRRTGTHSAYACPHVNCGIEFQQQEEWSRHIQVSHHDLLDNAADWDSRWN